MQGDKRKRKKRNRGFTMSELMVVVAIMGVVALLATGAIINIQRSVRQRKLDDSAKQIYMAAQQEMTTLKCNGQKPALTAASADTAKPLDYTPSDASEKTKQDIENGLVNLQYFSNADTNIAELVLPEDMIEPELRGGKWIIEYDAENANVYGVFYAEETQFSDDTETGGVNSKYATTFNSLRLKADARKGKTHATVGYYGGSSLWEQDAKDLDASLNVENAEQLKLYLTFKAPQIQKTDGTKASDTIRSVEIVVKDEDQPDKEWKIKANVKPGNVIVTESNGMRTDIDFTNLEQDPVTKRFFTSLILDSMEKDYGYHDITGLNVGDNIKITAKITTSTGIIGDCVVKTNSGFASKSNKDDSTETVAVAYGRHLQNLLRYAQQGKTTLAKNIEVVQRKDISFANIPEKEDCWYALYVADRKDPITFQPIENDKVVSFDGGNFLIQGMTIQASVPSGDSDKSIGMFKTFAGKELQNICMVDTVINADGASAVGTIAGRTNALTKMENCRAYLSDDYSVQLASGVTEIGDVNRVIRGGDSTGGLIGYVNGSKALEVTKSFASGSLEGNGYVGGLFGFINTTEKVSLKDSYADQYLFGQNVAGLAAMKAGQKLEISNCYAAGFAQPTQDSAGLVYAENSNANSGLTMEHAYSVVELSVGLNGTSSPITNVTGNGNNTTVFYMGTAIDSNKQGIPSQNMESPSFLKELGGNFAFGADTKAYNLMDNGLSDYTFPVLTELGKTHYGDWRASFNKGLVYYEKYSDGSYGFYGANTSLLKRNNNALSIVADGYAFAVSDEEYESNNNPLEVTFSGSQTIKDGEKSKTVVKNNKISVYDQVADATYVLVPLDQLIEEKLANSAPMKDYFYYMIQIGENAYSFNPYFARTAKMMSADEKDTANQKPGTVYVSTARQLNKLSQNSVYWNWAGVSYLQDYRIDYPSYQGYAVVNAGANTNASYEYHNIFNNASFNLAGDAQAVQAPIGTRAIPFACTYDGGGNTIQGVTFAMNAASKESTAIGLFGYNAGVVKNITLNGNGARRYAYGFTGENINSSNTYAYMGALVGYNSGTIENSAVTSYMPAASVTTGSYNTTIKTYNNSTLYIGGAVGINNGYISKVTVDMPSLAVESTSAFVYGGAFAGYNNGLISGAYGFGRIYGKLDTNLRASYGGFAGVNAGNIQNAYCGTSIVVSGRADKYAFANNRNTARNCYYLNNVDGSYYNQVYAYSATAQGEIGEVNSFAELGQKGIPGFSVATDTTITSTGAVFPYPAIIRRNGQIVSVGNWPTDAQLGDAGIVYWELEEGGNNPGLYFSTLDISNNRSTTLCTEHDDGGVITSYGYGYYYTTGYDGSAQWALNDYNYLNLGDGQAVMNSDVSSRLEAAMPGFKFMVYTSGEDAGALQKLQLTSGVSYSYEKRWVKDETKTASSEFKLDVNGEWENCTKEEYEAAKKENAACVQVNYQDGKSSVSLEYSVSGPRLQFSSSRSSNYYDMSFTGDPKTDTILIGPQFGTGNGYQYSNFALKKVTNNSNSDVSMDDINQIIFNDVLIPEEKSNGTLYWKFGYVESDGSWHDLTAKSYAQRVGSKAYYYRKTSGSEDVKMKLITTTVYTKADYQRKGEWGHYETVKVPGSDNSYAPNGSITLKSAQADISHTFIVNPFFGDSMALSTEETVDSLGNGTKSNYSIRSLEQMQLINWNCKDQKASKDYESFAPNASKTATDNYQYYIYLLRYGYNSKNNDVVPVEACKGGLSGVFTWNQSHDIGTDVAREFYPVGGLIDYGTEADAKAAIAAFGGTYNGQDYVVKNVKISSKAQCVGLFGMVMKGKLSHIVMNATTDNAIIEANKDGKNWYCLGGLVGFSAAGSNTTDNNKTSISNCSSSGYIIRDSRANHGYGGAGVGGLTGINNMDLKNCSAINQIELKFTYGDGSRNVRVGGIAGTCQGKVTNCYAGGSIGIPTNNSTNVYIGGLTGATYIKRNGNIQSLVGSTSAKSTVENSYSYVSLPTIPQTQKNVKGIAVFANPGDGTGSSVSVNEYCFYLKGTSGSAGRDTSKEMTYEQMADASSTSGMYAKLHKADSSWGMVSVSEGGVTVNGKYSFNSSPDLNGKNYPFPTILQQTSRGMTYNVHYGDWPTNGILVEDIVTMDLLSDRDTSGVAMKTVTARIANVDNPAGATFTVESDDTDIAVAAVQKVNNESYDIQITAKDIGTVTLTLNYQVAGGYIYTAYVTVSIEAVMNLNAPDLFTIQAGSEKALLSGWTAAEMSAVDRNGVQLTGGSWKVITQSMDLTVIDPETAAPTVLAVENPTSETGSIIVEYIYQANGKEYVGAKTIGVTIPLPAKIDVPENTVQRSDEEIAEPMSLRFEDLLAGTAFAYGDYNWESSVFTDFEYTVKDRKNLLEIVIEDGELKIAATEKSASTLPDKKVYVRVFGVSKSDGQSVSLQIPVNIINKIAEIEPDGGDADTIPPTGDEGSAD